MNIILRLSKIFFAIFFFLAVHPASLIAQTKTLQQVAGFPSTEVYDLFTDSKGFLWIAHNGGVSKYDGINFTNYSNPLQTSLSVTGLLEDKYGRIWFNNFTGQIFYIENGKMNLLSAYDSQSEPNFPRMGLFKDMLVATSKRGLFICDINTLKCHYQKCADRLSKGTTSLSVQANQIIAYGYWHWYIYRPGTGLKMAFFNKADTKLIEENAGTLNVKTFRDTAFVFCNPGRVLYKLLTDNDSLRVCQMQQFDFYINTVTVLKNSYVINTVKQSIENPGNQILGGEDITSLSVDKQGHKWYGSLGKGLLTNLESENPLKDRCSIPLLKNDVIKYLLKYNDDLLIGSQNGKLIRYNPGNGLATLVLDLGTKSNGVSYLKMVDKDKLVVGSPTRTFIYDIKQKKTEQTFQYTSVKQVDTISNALVMATSPGLIVCPINTHIDYDEWKKAFTTRFKGFSQIEADQFKFLGIEQRAKAVCCFAKTGTIWAALKNGLYRINRAGISPFIYKGSSVYASCLTTYGKKVIAGTFNNGILIIDGSDIRHLTTDDGLLSDNVLQLKVLNRNLWVYNRGVVQVFDLKTLKIINNYQLPNINDGIVTDAEDVNGHPYLANAGGLYKISSTNLANNYHIYLNSLSINGRDTGTVNNITLPYYRNDIQVNLGVPSLPDAKNIIIKYRLSTGTDAKWAYSKAGERNFRFESLMPGHYQFEAIAGRPQSGISGKAIKINFIITPPWWKRWWALFLMGTTGALMILGFARLYYINLLSNEKAEFEKKLAIEKERQRISSDMHDDIGASLAAIKLYAGSIQKPGNAGNDFDRIHDMMTELSNKVREVIWRLDNKNDTIEGLLNFIEATSYNLFKYADINFKVGLPGRIPHIQISSDKRQDVFLVVREALHNIIKHSEATHASIKFDITNDYLKIDITDDGIGIQNHSDGTSAGYGISNMKQRLENLHGSLHFETNNGTILKLKIPLVKGPGKQILM